MPILMGDDGDNLDWKIVAFVAVMAMGLIALMAYAIVERAAAADVASSPYDELYEDMVTSQAEFAEVYWDPETSDVLRQDARARFGALIVTCMDVAARVGRDYEPCFKPIFHEEWTPDEEPND